MVLRQGKRRVFLASSGNVCVMADTRCHAANHSPAHYGDYPCRLFCGGTGFQTARLDVLVSRRCQRADACRFRRQPVCQTNAAACLPNKRLSNVSPDCNTPTCRLKVYCIPVALRKSGARSLSSTAQPLPFWQACNITIGGRLIQALCRMC